MTIVWPGDPEGVAGGPVVPISLFGGWSKAGVGRGQESRPGAPAMSRSREPAKNHYRIIARGLYGGAVAIQVIVLNGGSSAGKSGIARCLQSVLPDPWLSLGIDKLIEAMPTLSPTAATGIEVAADGEVIIAPEFWTLEAAWMTGLAAMARAGARIILDEVLLGGAAGQQRWNAALAGLSVLWVGVRCDQAIATAREVARGDRIAGMAASQAQRVHQGVGYDLEVDSSHTEALECAQIIAAHVLKSD